MKLLIALIAASLLLSCEAPGTTKLTLKGDEDALPPELKGLKVYSVVYDSSGNCMNIAVLDRNNMVTTGNSVVLVDNSGWDKREIEIKKIIMENDSMIIALK